MRPRLCSSWRERHHLHRRYCRSPRSVMMYHSNSHSLSIFVFYCIAYLVDTTLPSHMVQRVEVPWNHGTTTKISNKPNFRGSTVPWNGGTYGTPIY
jgi:hypothetical protein